MISRGIGFLQCAFSHIPCSTLAVAVISFPTTSLLPQSALLLRLLRILCLVYDDVDSRVSFCTPYAPHVSLVVLCIARAYFLGPSFPGALLVRGSHFFPQNSHCNQFVHDKAVDSCPK